MDEYGKSNEFEKFINNMVQIIIIEKKKDKYHTELKILISESVGARTSSQKIPCFNNSVIVLPSGEISASDFALMVPEVTE